MSATSSSAPPTIPTVEVASELLVSPTAAPVAAISPTSSVATPTAASQPKKADPQCSPPNSSRWRWSTSARAGARRSSTETAPWSAASLGWLVKRAMASAARRGEETWERLRRLRGRGVASRGRRRAAAVPRGACRLTVDAVVAVDELDLLFADGLGDLMLFGHG